MKRSISLLGLVLLFVAGCAAPPGHISVSDASNLRPGMTRAEVVSTLGEPEFNIAMNGEETMSYLADGRSWQDRPFEVKLVDGVVQSYTVAEPDPAKADLVAGTFKPQVAIPWYSAKDYEQMVVLLPAAERENAVPYEDWMAYTTRVEDEIRGSGRVPVRVTTEPVEVESWCVYHGVPLSKEAIDAFAGMRLALERGSSAMKTTVASDVGRTGNVTGSTTGTQAAQ
jgi:hypothetical protein